MGAGRRKKEVSNRIFGTRVVDKSGQGGPNATAEKMIAF